jgi:hypothetical protein
MLTTQTCLETSRGRNGLWMFLIGIIILSTLSACGQSSIADKKMISFPGYLIAGQDENFNFSNNSIMLFDSTTLSQISVNDLPNSNIQTGELDTDGNLWIGLSGGTSWDDDRVVILNPMGKQIAEIHACLFPTAGIWFYGQKAYVVCRDTGFISTIVQIDAVNFKVEKKITVELGSDIPFVATSSRLLDSYLVIGGSTHGPDETLPYSALITVDLATFTVYGKMELGAGTDTWSMVPYRNKLYLLNVGNLKVSGQDILILDVEKQKITETISLGMPSPLWGAVSNDILYTYHNGGWNSIYSPSERAICQLNLINHEQHCQSLTNNFNAYDLDVINGKPCITHWGDSQPGGLYCLDEKKALNLSIEFNDASLVIIKK